MSRQADAQINAEIRALLCACMTLPGLSADKVKLLGKVGGVLDTLDAAEKPLPEHRKRKPRKE